MNATMRSGTASLAVSILLCASLAQAVARPEDKPFGDVWPTDRSRIHLGEDPYAPLRFYGAVQGPDCDRAGTANPRYREPDVDGDYGLGARYRSFGLGLSNNYFLEKPRFQPNLGLRYSIEDERSDEAPKVNLQLRGSLGSPGLNFSTVRPLYMMFREGLRFTWPGDDSRDANAGWDADPIKRPLDKYGRLQVQLPYSDSFESGTIQDGLTVGLRVPSYGSINIEAPASALPGSLNRFYKNELTIGGTPFTTLKFKDRKLGLVYNAIDITVMVFENNWCRVVLTPTDPNYTRTGRHGGGSWGQSMDDQWAIKRVGYTEDESSAWNQVPDTAAPVVVAVIDTGLDWHHLDISYKNIWRNEGEIPDNGIDDDNNGFVDDIVGWDFLGRHNKPWDFDGHGTVVAGIIAARQNNGAGIAGINPHAKIMVLKGVNNFGTTRASYLAEAIVYAADNGARVINISVGGPHTSRIEQAAIDYAHEKGVLVVAASGNEGIELEDYGPGGRDHVLTVGATHIDDRAAGFSNFGSRVDLVAPGVDILSLRARYTDANYRGDDAEYEIGTNYVGEDKRYLHVSGTSFSAPMVSGTASLLLARSPELTAAQVENILVQTAEDIEFPGKDKYAGFGLLDARTALSVDPDFFVTAAIDGVQLVESEGRNKLEVTGTADAQVFKRAWMQIGAGEKPGAWKSVGQKVKFPVRKGTLGRIDFSAFAGSKLWQVVVNVEHKNGTVKRAAYAVRLR
jgi:subtilisin family serine protease